MSKVFLAYKTVDVERANFVRTKLEALGVPLFIDQKMKAGDNYITAINEELATALAVLVLWTAAAIRVPTDGEPPNFVLSEAQRGYQRSVLVAATFDKTALDHLPVPFNLFQSPDLSEWISSGGAGGHVEWQKVLQALGKKLNRPALPALAVALESNGDELKRKFLKDYPDDPLSHQIADSLEAFERKEFETSVSAAKKRIEQRGKEAQKRLNSCRNQFEKQIAELRAGRNFMPPNPADALADNVAALQNQIEIYEDALREERARADNATAEAAAIKVTAKEAAKTDEPPVSSATSARSQGEIRRLITWSGLAAVIAAVVFAFIGYSFAPGADEVTALNAQVEDLSAKSQALQSQLKTLSTPDDDSAAHIQALRAQLKDQQELTDELSVKLKTAAAQADGFSAQLKAEQARTSDLSVKNQTLQEQLKAAQAQASDLSVRNQTLHEQLKAAQARAGDVSVKYQTMQEQLKAAQGKADDLLARNQTLQGLLKAAQDRADGALAKDQVLQAELIVASTEKTRLPLATQCDALAGYPFDPDRPITDGYADSVADATSAQAVCQNALQTSANDKKAQRRILLQIGRAQDRSGDTDKAIRSWQQAAELGSSQALLQLATYYANRSNPHFDPKVAFDDLKKSADMDPASPVALYRAANSLLFPNDNDNPFKSFPGDVAEGEDYLQRALNMDYGPAFYTAGVYYWRKGDQARGKTYLLISWCMKHYADPPYDAQSYYQRQAKQSLTCQ